MSLISDVVTLLNDDPEFSEAMTAGAFEGAEIDRQLTPDAFDANKELLPCALVKTGNENALQNKIGAVQTTLVIYFYQRSGYAAIDIGLARALALLNRKHETGVWEYQFNTEIARTTDDALKCSLAVQRYNVIRQRNLNSIGS